MKELRVLVVDPADNDELAAVLSPPVFAVCGCANNAPEAIELAGALKPDVALLDVASWEAREALLLAETLRARAGVPSVLVSSPDQAGVFSALPEADAHSLVATPLEPNRVARAIRRAVRCHDAELSLKRSQEHRNLAVQSADMGTWEWRLETGEVLASGETCRIFGLAPEDFSGTYEAFFERVYPDDREWVRAAINRTIEESGVIHIEFRTLKPDTTVAKVAVRGRLVDDGHQYPFRMIGVVFDASAWKDAAEYHDRFEAELNEAQRDTSLALLAGGIAHDFNNLLVGILGNAELAILQLPPDSPVRRTLERIEMAALRAADLTRQIQAYSGSGNYEIAEIDLSALVRDLSSLIATAIAGRAEYRFELEPRLPPIDADAAQVRQVVMNLITNAAEAVTARNGIITVRTGQRRVQALDDSARAVGKKLEPGDYVYLQVEDTGCGMDAATRKKIFDPFFSTKFQGRGMGLSVVIGILRGHGGAVMVESEAGRGTVFTALFPRATVTSQASVAAAAEVGASDAPKRRSILVVDDEQTVREMLDEFLTMHGYRVSVAVDGLEAMEVFEGHPDEFDAILLDLTMPQMGGEQVFERMRALRPDARVILMSGYDEQQVIRRFAASGLVGYLAKPFRLPDVLEKLADALGKGNTGHGN